MYKALVFKELREIIGIAALALLAYMLSLAIVMGYNLLQPLSAPVTYVIPFISTNFGLWFCFISVIFSTALGIWQTVVESRRGTWLFLLHRPMGQRKLICVKMAVGAGVYLVVSGAVILFYAVWAATPGKHASPFFWWMTVTVWKIWILIGLCYLGAFLAGIRPGRWFGTRLLPVIAAGFLAFLIGVIVFKGRWLFWGFMAFAFICVLFISMILFAARTRDFS